LCVYVLFFFIYIPFFFLSLVFFLFFFFSHLKKIGSFFCYPKIYVCCIQIFRPRAIFLFFGIGNNNEKSNIVFFILLSIKKIQKTSKKKNSLSDYFFIFSSSFTLLQLNNKNTSSRSSSHFGTKFMNIETHKVISAENKKKCVSFLRSCALFPPSSLPFCSWLPSCVVSQHKFSNGLSTPTTLALLRLATAVATTLAIASRFGIKLVMSRTFRLLLVKSGSRCLLLALTPHQSVSTLSKTLLAPLLLEHIPQLRPPASLILMAPLALMVVSVKIPKLSRCA
jgi:hypothetical protein